MKPIKCLTCHPKPRLDLMRSWKVSDTGYLTSNETDYWNTIQTSVLRSYSCQKTLEKKRLIFIWWENIKAPTLKPPWVEDYLSFPAESHIMVSQRVQTPSFNWNVTERNILNPWTIFLISWTPTSSHTRSLLIRAAIKCHQWKIKKDMKDGQEDRR